MKPPKHRIFEEYGIYISIVFRTNLDREPRWHFIINDLEECLFSSGVFGEYEKCEIEAIKKAIDFL